MSEWKAKRFWESAEGRAIDGGFAVFLDARMVKTPAKKELVVPTLALASAIAKEWDAQVETINPTTMPMTRSANVAIDKVATQFSEVAEIVASYGESDLICYLAEGPQELIERQKRVWQPLLDRTEKEIGVSLAVGSGVVPISQEVSQIQKLKNTVAGYDSFELTALHELVSLSGSLVIGLAAMRDWAPDEELWAASRVDEDWQIEAWGEDEEAQAVERAKWAAFAQAKQFAALLR